MPQKYCRKWSAVALPPDLVTDQTSAHDPLGGYIPAGLTVEQAAKLRESNPRLVSPVPWRACVHAPGHVDMQKAGAIVFDYGNNIRQNAYKQGVKDAFAFPGFVPAYIRPQFCEGRGPFRWVALSGDPADIAVTDDLVLELFPEKKDLRRWIEMARQKGCLPGGFRPESAGWDTANASSLAWPSLTWSGAARSRLPSSSGATTWTAGLSPRPTGRPKP